MGCCGGNLTDGNPPVCAGLYRLRVQFMANGLTFDLTSFVMKMPSLRADGRMVSLLGVENPGAGGPSCVHKRVYPAPMCVHVFSLGVSNASLGEVRSTQPYGACPCYTTRVC